MRSDIYDRLRVDIASNGLSATAIPIASCPTPKPTPAELAAVLRSRGVTEGIDLDGLALFIEDWRRGTMSGPRIVATGTPPKVAAVASLKRVSPPARSGDNPVELLPLFVKKGETIFSIGSTGRARPGTSVRGDSIAPDPRAGGGPIPGTSIEVANGRWTATQSGFLVVTGDRIDVSNTLTHNRDLPPGDYRWGGDVCIRGKVLGGTSLRAAGSICIEGSVEDGVTMQSDGSIEVRDTIDGHDTRIVAHHTVRASAVRSASIVAERDVVVTDLVEFANIRCGGEFDASHAGASVQGARIEAVRGAKIDRVESTKHQRTSISVGAADWVNSEVKSIDQEIERWEHYHSKLCEDFRTKYGHLLGNRDKLQRLSKTDRRLFERAQQDVTTEQDRVDRKIRELRQRQTDLDSKRVRDESASITVRNGAPEGCRFVIRGREYTPDGGTLPKGRTVCMNPDTGRIHAIPTGLVTSSELFS